MCLFELFLSHNPVPQITAETFLDAPLHTTCVFQFLNDIRVSLSKSLFVLKPCSRDHSTTTRMTDGIPRHPPVL